MPEIIRQDFRLAKKPHVCDYCGDSIQPGELYNYAVLKYDDFYEWKCHDNCHLVAQELWNWLDPGSEGLDSEHFQEGCNEFCREYICKGCEQSEPEDGCKTGKPFCMDKLAELLRTHTYRRIKHGRGWWKWELAPRMPEAALKGADHE